MKALVLDQGGIRLRHDHPEPGLQPGWAVVRVTRAGICRTDLELSQGYMGFSGVLGHEFVGEVKFCQDESWIGKRVVGEINAACGTCEWCARGLARHCPHRSVLGILNLDGCMAEMCALPVANLHQVPSALSDDQAVFTEPLSAAYEILDQIDVHRVHRCLVLGDGKLGILCAWVLSTVMHDVTLVGRHPAKLALAAWRGVKTLAEDEARPGHADLVVDATGRGRGFSRALELLRPRGTLVLKSTVAAQGDLNLAPIVINEITVVGSRCGRFEVGLPALLREGFPVERLICARFPLAEADAAFRRAAERGALKVLLDVA